MVCDSCRLCLMTGFTETAVRLKVRAGGSHTVMLLRNQQRWLFHQQRSGVSERLTAAPLTWRELLGRDPAAVGPTRVCAERLTSLIGSIRRPPGDSWNSNRWGGRREKGCELSTPDRAVFEECALFTIFQYIYLQSSLISFTNHEEPKSGLCNEDRRFLPPLQHFFALRWSTFSSFILKTTPVPYMICQVSLRRWKDAAGFQLERVGPELFHRVLVWFCCQGMVVLQLGTRRQLSDPAKQMLGCDRGAGCFPQQNVHSAVVLGPTCYQF